MRVSVMGERLELAKLRIARPTSPWLTREVARRTAKESGSEGTEERRGGSGGREGGEER
jgi:hypothetical protein